MYTPLFLARKFTEETQGAAEETTFLFSAALLRLCGEFLLLFSKNWSLIISWAPSKLLKLVEELR
jgi:hypothetical protein